MNSKMLLLSIAVISVGLFAMPSTLSLFAGQHTFYSGDSVNCAKCHQDVYNEMSLSSSSAHVEPALKACQGCHRMTNASTWSKSTVNGVDIPYNGTWNLSQAGINFSLDPGLDPNAHSAVTLECVTCHQGVPAELVGSNEAHTQYYLNASYNRPVNTYVNATTGQLTNYTNPYLSATANQTTVKLKGANTACVGCHTHIMVNVTWIRAQGYNLTADMSGGGNTALGYKYNLTFTALNGTSTTYSAGQ